VGHQRWCNLLTMLPCARAQGNSSSGSGTTCEPASGSLVLTRRIRRSAGSAIARRQREFSNQFAAKLDNDYCQDVGGEISYPSAYSFSPRALTTRLTANTRQLPPYARHSCQAKAHCDATDSLLRRRVRRRRRPNWRTALRHRPSARHDLLFAV